MINSIILPIKDFEIIYDGFKAICDEYAGAQEIEENYRPVLDKYYSLYQEIKGDN